MVRLEYVSLPCSKAEAGSRASPAFCCCESSLQARLLLKAGCCLHLGDGIQGLGCSQLLAQLLALSFCLSAIAPSTRNL